MTREQILIKTMLKDAAIFRRKEKLYLKLSSDRPYTKMFNTGEYMQWRGRRMSTLFSIWYQREKLKARQKNGTDNHY